MKTPENILGIDPAMLAQFQEHAKAIEAITSAVPEGLVALAERINAMPLGEIGKLVAGLQRKP